MVRKRKREVERTKKKKENEKERKKYIIFQSFLFSYWDKKWGKKKELKKAEELSTIERKREKKKKKKLRKSKKKVKFQYKEKSADISLLFTNNNWTSQCFSAWGDFGKISTEMFVSNKRESQGM